MDPSPSSIHRGSSSPSVSWICKIVAGALPLWIWQKALMARGSSHVIRLGAFNKHRLLPFARYFLSIFSLAAACSCSPLLLSTSTPAVLLSAFPLDSPLV